MCSALQTIPRLSYDIVVSSIILRSNCRREQRRQDLDWNWVIVINKFKDTTTICGLVIDPLAYPVPLHDHVP